MGSTTFGLDQIDFLLGVCLLLIMTVIGVAAYAIVVIDDRNKIFRQNKRLNEMAIQNMDKIEELTKHIKKKTPGGWPAFLRDRWEDDPTIYADYKEITVPDLKAKPQEKPTQTSAPDYDKAIRDATAALARLKELPIAA